MARKRTPEQQIRILTAKLSATETMCTDLSNDKRDLEERLEGAEAAIAQLQQRAEEAELTASTEHDIATTRQCCVDDLDSRLAAAAELIDALEKRAESAEKALAQDRADFSKKRAHARMRHEDSTRDTVAGWDERDLARSLLKRVLEAGAVPPELVEAVKAEAEKAP